jgi:hypothetical protein
MPVQDPGSTDKDLRIKDVKAFATSYPIPPGQSVTLGIGRAVKRDAVVVKVTTEGGLVGYGESHHGRAHTAIAQLVNTTLRQLILGMNAADVVGCWNRIYSRQLVPLHRGFDWLSVVHRRTGRCSGSTSISILRARPGCRVMKPDRSNVSTIW